MPETAECPDCGNTVRADDDGRAVCYGAPPNGPHTETVVLRPCGVCGDPIRTAEICDDCAAETPGDAFTTNWGDGAGALDGGDGGD
jgi:ribosomal protein L32